MSNYEIYFLILSETIYAILKIFSQHGLIIIIIIIVVVVIIIIFISSWCKIVKILIKTNHPVDTTIVPMLLSAQRKMSDLIPFLA